METQLITCEACGTSNRVASEKLARGLNPVCGRCKSPLPNSTSKPTAENAQSPAPKLSPEFLAGSTEAGLDKIRTRLLDLTNRNRLLNFRHTVTSSLRAADADLDAAFQGLLEAQKLTFVPVPEPEGYFESDDEEGPAARTKPPAAEYAKSLEWPNWQEMKPTELPVLLYIRELEARTRKIGSAAKTAIEESGANMLYLIFGFLEWYEADDSQLPHLAPLLTVPVSLERSEARAKVSNARSSIPGRISLRISRLWKKCAGISVWRCRSSKMKIHPKNTSRASFLCSDKDHVGA